MKPYRVILLIESSRGFGRDLLRGIAKYVELYGPWAFYRTPPVFMDIKDQKFKKEMAHMKEWKPDGIIIRDLWKDIDDILALELPTIISPIYEDRKDSGIPNIYVDNVGIGRMAAEHLIEKGFKRFAFCGLDEYYWSNERYVGFSEKIAEMGYETITYPRPQSLSKRLWENEQVLLIDWLKSLPKPIGVMGCVDDRCQDIIEACNTAGIYIPEEVALVGGDNDELICSLLNPPISSVAINGIRAGYEAASLLHKLMRGEETEEQTVFVKPTYVVTRRSTELIAIEDQDVSNALRFIRENCKKKIQVIDVAEHVGLSQRTLERRFISILHRAVSDEIKRITTEYICRLLVETNTPISQIAYQFGFYEPNNLSRCFHSVMGMSPREYRKRYGQK